MTARPDELVDELAWTGPPAEAEHPDLVTALEDAPTRGKRRARSFRACYACVDIGGRPLTAAEDAALRALAGALLEHHVWIGGVGMGGSPWLTTARGDVLERLEFRTLPPKPAERLSFVEVIASTRSRAARPARKRKQTARDPSC